MEAQNDVRVVEVPEEQCWELLRTAGFGRVAWNAADGPSVLPVNFACADGRINIRTPAFSALVQKADAERVAFQVDRIDEATHTGWSVLARGRAEVRYGDEADAGARPEPWPRGPRSAVLVVHVDQISGRQLVPWT
jgi:nitroimidazol reductase NimA-like FMN-containing flavoprotein (pyridoxamine 5'-phosphate oxidase superfamily)